MLARPGIASLLVLGALALGASPASAAAAGGARTPENGGAAYGEVAEPEEAKPAPRRTRPRAPRRSRRAGRPVLESFSVGPRRFYAYGSPARVRFRIGGRARSVTAWLRVSRPGSRAGVVRIPLGERATGVDHTVRLSGRPNGTVLPQGELEVRLLARDAKRRTLRTGARASARQAVGFYWHRFPVRGSFDWGGEGSRFGSDRPGHSHQGQDLTAPEGTPLVAVRGGVVQQVAYQAEGAGHYVILDGEGEDRDYAYMHLQTGSITVRQGQRVRTGQLVGRVGSTGASSGPHLHFEIWEHGGWYEGGRPVDPLPYLRRWYAWSR